MTWNTNWKVLAEKLHGELPRPGLSQGTIGPQVSLSDVECPEGRRRSNYHCALKSRRPVSGARPPQEHPTFRGRSSTHLHHHHLSRPLQFRCRPATSGNLSLYPRSPGEVDIDNMAGVWRRNSVTIPNAQKHFASLKASAGRGERRGQGMHRKGLPGACGSDDGARPYCPIWSGQNFEFANYILSKLDA